MEGNRECRDVLEYILRQSGGMTRFSLSFSLSLRRPEQREGSDAIELVGYFQETKMPLSFRLTGGRMRARVEGTEVWKSVRSAAYLLYSYGVSSAKIGS